VSAKERKVQPAAPDAVAHPRAAECKYEAARSINWTLAVGKAREQAARTLLLTSNEAAVSLSVGGDAGREIAMTRTKCISWLVAQKRMEAVQNKK
jgi:hypothetical protein